MQISEEDRSGERREAHASRLHPPLGVLLLVVALLPVLGMAGIATASVQRLREERDAANHLEADVARLEALLAARVAVGDEEIASTVLVHASEYGASMSQVEQFLGFDVTGELREARARVDADPLLAQRPRLARAVQALVRLRPSVDSGELGAADLLTVTEALREELDAVWGDTVTGLTDRLLDAGLPGAVQVRFTGLASAYELLAAATDQAVLTELLLTGGASQAQRRQLVAAAGTYQTISQVLATRLGPAGQEAWSTFVADQAAQRFDRSLGAIVRSLVDGEPATLGEDPRVLAAAFVDIPVWMRAGSPRSCRRRPTI